MFSKNSHGYCAYAHTVRVKDLLFHLYHLYVYVFGQWTVMDSSFLKKTPAYVHIRTQEKISLYSTVLLSTVRAETLKQPILEPDAAYIGT